MNKLANLLLEKEILLESGTNELEILVFDVGHYVFGVNVAKVREVLPAPAITHLPNAHPSIRGVFKLRNQVVPCVSLADYLGEYVRDDTRESTCILTDLNQQQTAFLVDRVERIHRLSWENVLAVPPLDDLAQMPVTALARCQDRLILMLDFEMILDQVTDQYFRTELVDNPASLPREQALILLVEDSPTVREAITQTLSSSGYSRLIVFENGKEAWQWLEEEANRNEAQGTLCHLVIADIEMPQVDGLHLTKRIKTHPKLSQIPVLLYSSIITPENKRKGEAVGADAQVAKPDLCHVVEYADRLIFAQGAATPFEDGSAVAGEVEESTPLASCQDQTPVAQTGPALQAGPPAAGDGFQQEPDASRAEACESAGADSGEAIVSHELKGLSTSGNHRECPLAPEEKAGAERGAEQGGANGREDIESQARAGEPLHELDGDAGTLGLRPGEVENEHLWNTFSLELQHRWQALAGLRRQIAATEGTFEPARSFDLVVDVARILHTIKSAAMVVPVEIVTRVTHALESLIEAASDRNEWPFQAFSRYCDWLEMFLNPVDQTWESWVESGHHLATDLEQQGAAAQGAGQGVSA